MPETHSGLLDWYEQLGLPVPANRVLWALVKLLEGKRG